ncbi:putative membrane protein [Microbacterium testaceum]|uniref:hypothetical protein n=1 Tax=Microbacterium testaceum TaxID=2033 RepID=UPI00278998CB|nr:hypothetical protein [Microbacterium testaceum]MDQ1172958.1 putative membrane protein [Microbacterium testaceum]
MRRFRMLPLWVLAPIYFVLISGVYLAGGQVGAPDRPLVVGLVGTVIFGVGMTVAFIFLTRRARRDAGGAGELERIRRALKTGRLPDHIDVVAWRSIIERRHQQLQRALWLNPVAFGLMTLVALSLTITRSPYWSLAAAFFIVMLVVSVVTTPRSLRKSAVIREELAKREAIAEGTDLRPGEARVVASRDDDPAHTPPSP